MNLGRYTKPLRRRYSALSLWTRPPPGYLKCNIGVSWVNNHDMCGVGWILRDDKGTTILHSRLAFSNVGSQKEAELMAIQWAVCDMVYTRQ